jgi:hypothetical protein
VDEYIRRDQCRTGEMAAAMAKVGVALLALPLDELPVIASVQVHHDFLSRGLRVEMQLNAAHETAAGLLAWADALPDAAASGRERPDYLRLEVVAVLDGITVPVWGHLAGHNMGDAAHLLGLPLDGQTHPISIAGLRALAERLASRPAGSGRETCNA